MKMRGGVIRRPGVSLRIVATLLIITSVLVTGGVLITRFVSAETLVTPPDSCFAFSAGTITNYYDTEGNVNGATVCPRALTIPASISGVAVTSVGVQAFTNKQLTSVAFPNSLTVIGDEAFSNNPLTYISLPAVTSIGNFAFYFNQLTSLDLPAVTSVGDDAFIGNQLTSLDLPMATTVGVSAFANNQLASVSLPAILAVGEWAFSGNQLTTLSLPVATDIRYGAFSGNQLTSISMPKAINIAGRAFNDNKLTSITIPNSVTSITSGVFGNNRLVSIVIPDSVTSIEDSAFYGNQLTSVTLSSNLRNIERLAFSFNRLTDVSLPASLQSLEQTAFVGQNPFGVAIDWSTDPNHDLWSSDPAIVQSVHDSLWYPRLYTASASNLQNLTDGIMSEAWWAGDDYNHNGTTRDSLGGHLINPASTTVRYVDGRGVEIKPSEQLTGIRTSDNTPLRDYLVSSSNIQAPIDQYNPTPEETTDLQAGFAQYYRIGQSRTINAPTINGYATPASQTITLVKDNTVTFVYQALQAPTFTVPSPTTGVSPATFRVEGICSESVDNQTVATIPQSLRDTTVLSSAAFTVNCAVPHTEAGVSIALDRSFNKSLLKVFKQAGATVTDITDSVTFASEVIDGKTVTTIHYAIKDGGFGDEDETVDGKIVDPIFVTYAGSIAASPDAPNTGIAAFSQNAMIVIAGGAALALAMAILLMTMLHVSKRGNE